MSYHDRFVLPSGVRERIDAKLDKEVKNDFLLAFYENNVDFETASLIIDQILDDGYIIRKGNTQ